MRTCRLWLEVSWDPAGADPEGWITVDLLDHAAAPPGEVARLCLPEDYVERARSYGAPAARYRVEVPPEGAAFEVWDPLRLTTPVAGWSAGRSGRPGTGRRLARTDDDAQREGGRGDG